MDRYRLDFFCREAMLAVEMDGEQHDPGRDSVRDEVLENMGIHTHRIPNRMFFGIDESDCPDFIREIQKLCEVRAGRVAFPGPLTPGPSPLEG